MFGEDVRSPQTGLIQRLLGNTAGVCRLTGATAQQAPQGLEPGGAGGPGAARGHPGVEGALGLVVAAPAGALLGALGQVGEVLDEGAWIDVPETERTPPRWWTCVARAPSRR